MNLTWLAPVQLWLQENWLVGIQWVMLAGVAAWIVVRYRGFAWDLYRFCTQYLVLFLLLVVLYALMFAQVGNTFGLQNLFWSDDPIVRGGTSLSATLFLGLIGVLAYHLDPYPFRTAAKVNLFLGHSPLLGAVERAEGKPMGERGKMALEHLKTGPRSPFIVRLQRFLRVARVPFLVLLALPAILPDVFSAVPAFAPRSLWIWPGLGDAIDANLPARGPAGYALIAFLYVLGTLIWVAGILAGVFVVKLFLRVSEPIHILIAGLDRWLAHRLSRLIGWWRSWPAWARFATFLLPVGLILGLTSVNRLSPFQSGLLLAILGVLFLARPVLRLLIAVVVRVQRAFGIVDPYLNPLVFTPAPIARCPLNPAQGPQRAGGVAPVAGAGDDGPGCAGPACPAGIPGDATDPVGCLEGAERLTSIRTMLAVFLLFYGLSCTVFYDWFAPSSAILVFLAVIAVATAFIGYFWPNRRYLNLLGFVLWLAVVNVPIYRDRFENLDMYYDADEPVSMRTTLLNRYPFAKPGGDCPPLPASDEAPPPLVPDEVARVAWEKAAPRLDGQKPKLVVVSVSGGAARSAYWSALVLDQLAAALPGQFDSSVRIITGSSGGMLGTAVYVEALFKQAQGGAGKPEGGVRTKVPDRSLVPLARYIALWDLPRSLLPFQGSSGKQSDRGTILERDWTYLGDGDRDNPEKPSERRLQDYAGLEREGRLPSLIFSPMTVEDGRQLLISNLDLAGPRAADAGATASRAAPADCPEVAYYPYAPFLAISEGSKISERLDGRFVDPYSISAFEFFKLFPRATDFKVATAVRMNASFPLVSPAVHLPTNPSRRVVDAGYYDNYGIEVAAGWLDLNRDWLLANTSGVLLVQIRDGLSLLDRYGVDDRTPSAWSYVGRGFELITSPIEGASRVGSTRSMFGNDRVIQGVSDWFTLASGRRDFFTTVVFENPAGIVNTVGTAASDVMPGDYFYTDGRFDADKPIPRNLSATTDISMNWYLTEAEKQSMESSFPRRTEGSVAYSGWGAAERCDQRKDRRSRLECVVQSRNDAIRDLALRELVKLRNFERLLMLKDQWWPKDHAPQPPASGTADRSNP